MNGTGLLGHFALALKWIHYHMLEIGGFHLDSFLGNSALMPFNGLLSFPLTYCLAWLAGLLPPSDPILILRRLRVGGGRALPSLPPAPPCWDN